MSNQSQPAPPILLRRVRKYGVYRFARVDHLTSSVACAGYGSIGKVKVDCRLLFAKSHWGVLGKNPAGIIYLDLDFDQPEDCRLKSATVFVTLRDAEDHDDRNRYSREVVCPAKFTDSYGPRQLSGERREIDRTSNTKLDPHAEALGISASGVALEREAKKVVGSRWVLTGKLVPDGSQNSFYKTLKWKLTENDLEDWSVHGSRFRTAFALEHNGKQFHMSVQVKGKLRKWYNRVEKTFKFGSSEDEDSTVTLIRFGNSYNFGRDLGDLAESLPMAMEWANMFEIPVQVPEAMSADYRELARSYRHSRRQSSKPLFSAKPAPESNRQSIAGFSTQENPERAPSDAPSVDEDPDDVRWDELARAAGLIPLASPSPQTATAQRPLSTTPTPRLTPSPQDLAQESGRKAQNAMLQPPVASIRSRGWSPANGNNAMKQAEIEAPNEMIGPGIKEHDLEVLIWLARMPWILSLMNFLAFIIGFRAQQVVVAGQEALPSTESADDTSDEEIFNFQSRPAQPRIRAIDFDSSPSYVTTGFATGGAGSAVRRSPFPFARQRHDRQPALATPTDPRRVFRSHNRDHGRHDAKYAWE